MSSSTFKELRRALPMNRQKFPWEQARARVRYAAHNQVLRRPTANNSGRTDDDASVMLPRLQVQHKLAMELVAKEKAAAAGKA